LPLNSNQKSRKKSVGQDDILFLGQLTKKFNRLRPIILLNIIHPSMHKFMKSIFSTVFALGLVVLATTTALAQSPAAESIITARRVAEYGYANKNPLCLLAAAQIMASTSTNKLEAKLDKGGAPEAGAGKKPEIVLDADKLVKDAQAMSNSEMASEITALAGKIKTTRSRGAFGGPKMTQGQSVDANATDTYTIEFKGGEQAELVVVGDLDGDLDLLVYDATGNLVASDIAGTDKCTISWTPAQNSSYTVSVKNKLAGPNRYTLITN
jgi:hypothetical protein